MVKNGTPASPAIARASKRLAGAGRADQQRALGDLAAEARELGRVLQELDDFLQFLARFVDAGDVVERHLAVLFGQHLGAALAEPHRARARLDFCIWRSTKNAMPSISRNGSDWISRYCQIDACLLGLGDDIDIGRGQRRDQLGIGYRGQLGAEGRIIVERYR